APPRALTGERRPPRGRRNAQTTLRRPLPVTSEITNSTRKTKKRILASAAALPAMTPKPSTGTTTATIEKRLDHDSISDSFRDRRPIGSKARRGARYRWEAEQRRCHSLARGTRIPPGPGPPHEAGMQNGEEDLSGAAAHGVLAQPRVDRLQTDSEQLGRPPLVSFDVSERRLDRGAFDLGERRRHLDDDALAAVRGP